MMKSKKIISFNQFLIAVTVGLVGAVLNYLIMFLTPNDIYKTILFPVTFTIAIALCSVVTPYRKGFFTLWLVGAMSTFIYSFSFILFPTTKGLNLNFFYHLKFKYIAIILFWHLLPAISAFFFSKYPNKNARDNRSFIYFSLLAIATCAFSNISFSIHEMELTYLFCFITFLLAGFIFKRVIWYFIFSIVFYYASLICAMTFASRFRIEFLLVILVCLSGCVLGFVLFKTYRKLFEGNGFSPN